MPAIEVSGSTALVTGAAGGMGEHIARLLAERGADVVVVDRDAVGLTRVADAIRAAGDATVHDYVVDLADRSATDAMIDRIMGQHPDVNLLFNNAGVALGGRFGQVPAADFDWLLEINLLAPIRITRAFLPGMLARGNAQVVNTSSLFGLVGPAGQTAYSTSKFGLRGFSESLRSELEADGSDVGVTVVHPGGIRTNIAVNARIADGVDPLEAARIQAHFARMLSYPAAKAAQEIVDAAVARRPRLVIGADAKALDVLARSNPWGYWSYLERGMKLAGAVRR